MCTIFIAYKMHPKYQFIYLGNRDEFKRRPTAKSQFYKHVLMGKDLDKGGTWMGITEEGHFACLTNYRDATLKKEFETSRGSLITEYLEHGYDSKSYLDILRNTRENYKGYNMIFGTMETLMYYSNVSGESLLLKPGVYGLSNAYLDTPWVKVNKGKNILTDYLYDELLDVEALFDLLNDEKRAEIVALPNTGLEEELEHQLSSIHIDLETYGTVIKQVILVSIEGDVNYFEKTIVDDFQSTENHTFKIR